jgi:hypothetical protein
MILKEIRTGGHQQIHTTTDDPGHFMAILPG